MTLAWAIVQMPRQKGKVRLQDFLSKRRRPKKASDPKADLATWSAWADAMNRMRG